MVAICTERVEAKFDKPRQPVGVLVAICTERVEAKGRFRSRLSSGEELQSARSVWRQRLSLAIVCRLKRVAICTERVEAKCPSFD